MVETVRLIESWDWPESFLDTQPGDVLLYPKEVGGLFRPSRTTRFVLLSPAVLYGGVEFRWPFPADLMASMRIDGTEVIWKTIDEL